MSLSFFKTKIGISLIIAIALIATAIVIKEKETASLSLRGQIGLIADTSVKDGIKSGESTNLDEILGTSSPDIVMTVPDDASTTPENLTATDRFSRDFFQRYVGLKESGAAIDENTGVNLVNELLSNDYGSPTEEKTYTESDIHVSPASDLASIKAYANSLGAILQTPTPAGYEQELWVLARLNDTGNKEDLSKLSLNIARYTGMRDALLKLVVPNPLKATHIAIINSLSATLEGVRGMTYIETDPVGATKMIARYQDGMSSLPLILTSLKQYLQKQSISFSSEESGYILTQ